jgi:hypothetical protein
VPENDTHDRPAPRFRSHVAFLVWCPVLYLLTLLVSWFGFAAFVDGGVDLADVIGRILGGLFVFGIGGHAAFAFAVGVLVPAPRRKRRIALMAIATPVLLFAIGSVRTTPPAIVGIALVAVPAMLGYWATEPRPPADPPVRSSRP